MTFPNLYNCTVCVIGLGYVGLPLAFEISKAKTCLRTGRFLKRRVIGFDLVEISPSFEKGNTTLVHAERLICNFIGAMVRAGYYDSK